MIKKKRHICISQHRSSHCSRVPSASMGIHAKINELKQYSRKKKKKSENKWKENRIVQHFSIPIIASNFFSSFLSVFNSLCVLYWRLSSQSFIIIFPISFHITIRNVETRVCSYNFCSFHHFFFYLVCKKRLYIPIFFTFLILYWCC